MSRLLVLLLPLAALSASDGAKGSNTLSEATRTISKAESGGSTRGLFPSWNKDEHKTGDQRRRGLGWWSGANGRDVDTGLLQTRQLQATGGGCGDGIAGIRSSDGDGYICCSEECGVCGGAGCSSAGGDGFDESHCCTSSIASSGRMCAVTGEAPCIMEEAEGCGNGIAGVRSDDGTGDVCCVEECGVCGGPGCSTAGGPGFDGSHCCASAILAAGLSCEETGVAPCLIVDDDVDGDKDGDGGIDGFAYRGCYLAEGSNPFSEIFEDGAMTPELCFDTCVLKSSLYMGVLKGNECGCGEDVNFLASDKADGVCDESCPGDEVQTCGGALAYDLFELMDVDTNDDFVDDDSTCDGGIPGVQSANGNVCCQTACGICDGSSCVGYGDCCEEKIQDSGVLCSDSGTAPCILDSDSDDLDRVGPDGNEMTGYLYVGCFEESSYNPFTYISQMNGMTIRMCSEECGGMGADYAGVMDGDVCGCGSENGYLEADKEDGTCFTECAGDDGRTELCGGETSFGLLEIIYASSVTNSITANGAPSPAPELIAELNSDAAGTVVPPADAPTSSDGSVLTAYTHLGCFGLEVANNPFFSLIQMDGMTYHMCSEACGELDAIYIGVVNGNMCGCGNQDGYLLSLKPEGTCDVQCAGSAEDTETCGGSASFDLFLINYLANDDDYFGPDSAPVAAGASTSAGLEEGSAPYSDDGSTGDVDSTTDWETGQVTTKTAVAPMTGYQYSGCFEMEAAHDPFSTLTQMNGMTLNSCAELCGAEGATYSGVMNGDMCGCGSEEGYLTSQKESGLCLVECAGNDGRTEVCGGPSSFDLFEIIYMTEDGTGEDGSSGTSSVPAPSPELLADAEMTGYIYDGCYQIKAEYDPFSSLSQINEMTRRSCSEMCGSMGAHYAGVMDGDLCGCGSADNYLEMDKEDGSCLMECTGDDGRTEMCGGSASFDLFRIFYRQNDDIGGR